MTGTILRCCCSKTLHVLAVAPTAVKAHARVRGWLPLSSGKRWLCRDCRTEVTAA